MASLRGRERDAAEQREWVEAEGGRGETARSHAEIEDGRAGIAITLNGERSRLVVQVKANFEH